MSVVCAVKQHVKVGMLMNVLEAWSSCGFGSSLRRRLFYIIYIRSGPWDEVRDLAQLPVSGHGVQTIVYQ